MANAPRAALLRWRESVAGLELEEPELRAALLELADVLELIVAQQEQHAQGFRRLG